MEINRGIPTLVQVCSCTATDRTNGPKRAREMRLLWKTTGTGSVAAFALEEAGSLEAARLAKAARTAGFRAAGLETTWAARVAQLLADCRGS